jgi:hypothetical protein
MVMSIPVWELCGQTWTRLNRMTDGRLGRERFVLSRIRESCQ